ncbi:MAG: hypothetical protein GQ554_04835 [Deltaproteobacteria bacterium]|jgi:hypothetical protein|nr:hypothetical protein [Deltaproteobacteria bacterium]
MRSAFIQIKKICDLKCFFERFDPSYFSLPNNGELFCYLLTSIKSTPGFIDLCILQTGHRSGGLSPV